MSDMSITTSPAVLSVRLPSPARDRLKAAAAARGETVQVLVGALVERFLAEEGKRAPELARTLRTLRAAAPALRSRWGVRGLWVAGAVARGAAAPDAAVELECEFELGARVSLVGLASLRAELEAALGAPAALVVRGLDPVSLGLGGGGAEPDAVRAL